VVLDPRNGEILAMVSSPSFDPNINTLEKNWDQLRQDNGQPLFDRSSQGLYPPGSTMKIVTAAIGLDKFPQLENEHFDCQGAITIQGRVLHDLRAHGRVDLKRALAISCNSYFANLGMEIGSEDFSSGLKSFGWGEKFSFDLPIKSIPLNQDGLQSLNGLAESAMGQGEILVSPLFMALITGSIGNQGVMMNPYLVKDIRSPEGKVVWKQEQRFLRDVATPETAWRVQEGMMAVVKPGGTGTAASLPGIDVAGATEDDVEGQLNVFKTMLGKDYDAIIVVPITGMNLISGVVEANKKGIPVICSGTTLDKDAAAEAGAEIAAHMTYNFEEQGYVGAKYISEKIKASDGKNAKVAVIEGLAGAFQGEARRDGAVNAFEEAGMNVVSVQAGDWDRQKAFDIATNLIQSNPDLKGICCANDTMALGVVEALKVAGKKDQVYVTGIDFLDEARQSLKAGELDGSVAMAPYISGKGNLTLALKVLQKHDISKQSYYSPIALITQENVNEYDSWK
jgi:ABC-type sugar transport system substrate-binding protein